jgi:hypothetical protein
MNLSPTSRHGLTGVLSRAAAFSWSVAIGLGMLFPVALAGVPEPDTVFYGAIAIEGSFVTAAETNVTIELRRSENGPALVTYQMGQEAAAGDRYLLRAPMESGAPLRNEGASIVGDTVWVAVRKGAVLHGTQSHVIAGRGEFVNLNFGDVDSDGDGMSDSFELLHFGSNTGGNPSSDTDSDGRPNLREFLDGTNPTTPDGWHPADRTPRNWAIDIREVTEYALAWKLGEPWPTEPVVIPVDYVTRASSLWVSGEQYLFDNDPATSAPLWWSSAPVAPSSPALATNLDESQSREVDADTPEALTEAEALRALLFEEAHAARSGKSTSDSASVRVGRTGLHSPMRRGSATRELPAAFTPRRAFQVTVQVVPPGGTLAYAVEEAPPAGWLVRFVNAEGRMDSSRKRIKWGPFYGDQSRTLTYELTPMSEAPSSFEGVASFDGSSGTIEGDAGFSGPEGNTAPVLVARIGTGGVQLELRSSASSSVRVEASSNLADWTFLQEITTDVSGRAALVVPGTGESRFFRVRTNP